MMRKILFRFMILFSGITFVACQKTDTSSNDHHTAAPSSQPAVSNDNVDFVSDFKPVMSDSLPRIDIYSDDHQLDFVTETTDTTRDYTSCTVSVGNVGERDLNQVPALVKVRGNYTATNDKKPLRIKYDEPQSMLGLHQNKPYRDWLLLAGYLDWSFLRDACGLYLAHLLGNYYASDFRFVNVYINDNYWGVYLLCEQQQTGPGRVDITQPDKGYTGTDIGYFVEYDGYYEREPELERFTIDFGTLYVYHHIPINTIQNGFTIKSDIYAEEQNTFIKNYMQNVFRIAYEAIYNEVYYEFDSTFTSISLSDTLTNSYETINKIIDVNSLVNAYILADITCDIDIAWSSFYMDVDFGEKGDKKLRFEAPWDFDAAFYNITARRDEWGLYASSIVLNSINQQRVNPWFALSMSAPWFKRLVRDKFNAMVDQKAFDKVYQYIDTISNSFVSDFAANDQRWNYVGNQNKYDRICRNPKALNCKTQKQAADHLKGWLKKRVSRLSFIYNTFE